MSGLNTSKIVRLVVHMYGTYAKLEKYYTFLFVIVEFFNN